MYYFSQQTIIDAIEALKGRIPSKFIGLLSILRSIKTDVLKPNETYEIEDSYIGDWLNGTMMLENIPSVVSESTLYVRFANGWSDYVSETMFSEDPKLYALIIFIYKFKGFTEIPTNEDLLKQFIEEFHLSAENVNKWFDRASVQMEYSENCLERSVLKDSLHLANSTLTFEGEYSVKAKASELSRAPFIQTLYAGMDSIKCLLISRTDLEYLYPSINKCKRSLENFISRQIIYYGAPGTGKSHSVKRETEKWEKKGRVVRTTFHPDSDYSTFVGAYKPTTDSVQRYDIYNKPITKDGQPVMEQVITYEFVAQAFLQAYINAWKNREEPEFLIIEEINRGNCAQIFGDLFQLLDRGDDGYSEYSVHADKDLQKHLAKAFADVVLDDYPKVKSGEVLILPNNLYIRATMNTSDQSLFPIDSAFKRRWDWKYVPIAKGKDNNGCDLDWKIEIDDERYDWWTFVETINKQIFDTTDSADKQLGFFFCKARNNKIDAETFVGKVIFYLWNDVFKDYGFDNPIFADKNDMANPKLSFDKFYTENGEINKDKVKIFLANLGMIPTEETVEEDENESADSRSVKIPKYSINGSSEQFTTPKVVQRIIEDYAKQNQNISVAEMIELWNGISERNNLLVDSWQPSPNDNQPYADKRRTKIEWKNGVVWVSNAWTEDVFKKFMCNVKEKLNITISRVN